MSPTSLCTKISEMVWVSVKSWKFASQYGLNECLLHFITSMACIRNKRQMWVPMHSQEQKNLSCAGFWVFHREHPSNNSPSSPRNLGEGIDESPGGSFVAPSEQFRVQTDFIPQTSCFQVAKRSCGSLQPAWKFIPRSKEGEKGKQNPAALCGETPRSWVSRVNWKILTDTAEWQWNKSLMEMCPLPASPGTPAGTQVQKELHTKLFWGFSSDAAQPTEQTQVMVLRNMMAFWHSGTAKQRVREAKCISGVLVPHLNLLFAMLRELGSFLSSKTIHDTDNTLQFSLPLGGTKCSFLV